MDRSKHQNSSNMKLVSYAQNFEDVLLWRALQEVNNGFYIDVGANDPEIDSITKAFYDRGWHGINIEPISAHFQALQESRPRDINLQCAAGSTSGTLKLWECEIRGWATADLGTVKQHESNGYRGFYHDVPVVTLNQICEKHASKDIHFLKIDVEGFESEVIKGIDFKRYRPWILVIESTKPNTQDVAHLGWEETLLDSNYVFAYFDGLNRFYVAKEHTNLLSAIQTPPNVFDNFVTSSQHQLESALHSALSQINLSEAKIREAETKAQAAETKAQAAETKAQAAETKAQAAETKAQAAISEKLNGEATVRLLLAELDAVHKSTSWRVTTPLRWLSMSSRKILSLLRRMVRFAVRSLLLQVMRFVLVRPSLRQTVRSGLKHLGPVAHRLHLLAIHRGVVSAPAPPAPEPLLPEAETVLPLPPRAKLIYDELNMMIEKQCKEIRNP